MRRRKPWDGWRRGQVGFWTQEEGGWNGPAACTWAATSSDEGRHAPSAVVSACPGAPVQAGGHRGLSSPHFTAEASAGHQRPGGWHWAHAQGQPRYPELLKVKLLSTRTEADGRWAWGACPAGGRSQPGTGQRADGEDRSSGRKPPKAWNVDGTCDERLSSRGRPPGCQLVRLPGPLGWVWSPLASFWSFTKDAGRRVNLTVFLESAGQCIIKRVRDARVSAFGQRSDSCSES